MKHVGDFLGVICTFESAIESVRCMKVSTKLLHDSGSENPFNCLQEDETTLKCASAPMVVWDIRSSLADVVGNTVEREISVIPFRKGLSSVLIISGNVCRSFDDSDGKKLH